MPGYTGFVQLNMDITLPIPLESSSAESPLPSRKEACISPALESSLPEKYTMAYSPAPRVTPGRRYFEGSPTESER